MAEPKTKANKDEEILFTGSVSFDEQLIKKVARMQYNTYAWKKKLVTYIVSVVCVVGGLMAISDKTLSICMIAIGCVMFMNVNYAADSNSKKIIREMNGKYPVLNYFFASQGYKSTNEMDEFAKYSKVDKLVQDNACLYIYLPNMSVHVLEKSSVKECSSNAEIQEEELKSFMDFLSEKTSLSWTRPLSGNSLTLWNFIAVLKDKKSNETHTGQRLPDKK